MHIPRGLRRFDTASLIGWRQANVALERYTIMPKRSITRSPDIGEMNEICLPHTADLSTQGNNKASCE
jgi:hypothetical protein